MGGFTPVIIMQIDDFSRMEGLHDLRGGDLGREGGDLNLDWREDQSRLNLKMLPLRGEIIIF